MDVFKLAFETTIVGLLACLWLSIAIYLLCCDLAGGFFSRIVSTVAKEKKIPVLVEENQTLFGVGLLTLAYCLGSAILPISSQLLNDEHWPLTENAIRCQVFMEQQQRLEAIDYTSLPTHMRKELTAQHCSYWAPITEKGLRKGQRIWLFLQLWAGLSVKKEANDGKNREKILTLFQQQESAIMDQGSEKTERLRQLREKIIVLRGAVFSGFILFLICLFGYIARVNGHVSHWKRIALGSLLALSLTVFVLLNGYHDLRNRDIFDIPVLEGLLGIVTLFGGILVTKGVEAPFLKKRLLFVVAFFAALAYGGWISSEIMYDQQVISAFAVPRAQGETGKH